MRVLPWALIAALSLGLGATACSDAPSREQCETLLDHVVDLEIQAAGTGDITPAMKADLEKQRKKLRDYVGAELIKTCMDEISSDRVACAIKAPTREALAACDKD
ncbi:MAG TPA: hypothetical protein VFG83_07065 [Kofleriaceae bacterium]|nr:hypothetical protein [Kofleriaceae bacterium]